MAEQILVIAAHPDDEVLGCGGTIAKLTDQDARVHVLFLADGVSSRNKNHTALRKDIDKRYETARQANKILGVTSVDFCNFPDNRMDTVGMLDIIKPIESMIAEHQPDTVITHHAGDVNIDHRLTNQAVVAACRPQRGNPVLTLLFFETPSSTEWQPPLCAPAFIPNWFVDISAFLERKMTALDAYATELRPWPHPRSRKAVEHLARWRGSIIGVDAAEALILGRRLS